MNIAGNAYQKSNHTPIPSPWKNILKRISNGEQSEGYVLPPLSASKNRTPSKTDRRKPDTEHLKIVAAEINALLADCPDLDNAVKAEGSLDFLGLDDEIAILWKAHPEQPIEDTLHMATLKALRKARQEKNRFEKIWCTAKKVLGYLCLYAVKDSVIEELRKNEDFGKLHFEIAVATHLGVEVVHARFQQVNAYFKTGHTSGAHAVEHHFQIDQGGWNKQACLDAVLREIWAVVIPNIKLDDNYTLSNDQHKLEMLDGIIELRHEHGDENHYLMVNLPKGTSIQNDVAKPLKDCLPALTVVFFCSLGTHGKDALINEARLIAAVSEFLLIPERINRE